MAITSSDTLNLLKSIKRLIEAQVLGQQTIHAIDGDNLTVDNAACYDDGDLVLLYDSTSAEETIGHERQVMARCETTLRINAPLPNDDEYAPVNVNAIVKRYGGVYLRNIVLGNPPRLPPFPLIIIDGDILDDSPFTIGGTSNVIYGVTVSVYVDGPDYETAYNAVWTYAKAIERVLTARVNPTICPDGQAIWKVKHNGQQHAQQGILHVVHSQFEYHEVLQRLSDEIPILMQFGQTM